MGRPEHTHFLLRVTRNEATKALSSIQVFSSRISSEPRKGQAKSVKRSKLEFFSSKIFILLFSI
ncbi:hypothetical protein C63 [Sulfolobus turreted icosahedral virus 1]|uniref:Uncharacterized protein n=1 Tax=Sulfolobus turreted icosahedral virus 1 TaxID=269145 RepID=Q6Q0L8_9VIRU|nr:hypothetical protein C63 [Sulfolobus turreted icosahedral virus 1]AAS89073.1 hypothetical protein C63 [Sulfolobus turreted icosahedral virus 1]